jgi:hypothetical protein
VQAVANGPPEALQDAIKFLLQTCRVPVPDDDPRRRRYDSWDLTSVNDVYDAKSVCERLAELYRLALRQKGTTPSLMGLRVKLSTIESLSGKLSRTLKRLNQTECYAIHDIDDYSETTQAAKIASYYEKLEDGEYLPAAGPSHQTEPGLLAQQLETLSLLMNALNTALRERYGRQKSSLQPTKPPLFMPAAIWQLIDNAWRVFSVLGMEPSGTVGGPLYDFIKAIDLWTTGRHAKIEHYFKRYIPIRQEFETLFERFQVIRKTTSRYGKRDFDVGVLQKTSSKVPPDILAEALANEARRSELEILLSYGS